MKNLLFIVLLILVIACEKTPETKTQPNPALQLNWKALGVAGKPESIIEINYQQHVPDSMLGDVITRESFFFDETGNLITRETYGEKQLLQIKNQYEYDTKSNIIKVTTSNSQGRTTNVRENILDSIGNAKQVKNFDHDGNLVYQVSYKYDTHRNPIEWKQDEPAIAVVYKRRYAYDAQGRCLLKEDITGGTNQIKEVISYDSANTVTSQRSVDGKLDVVTTEKFDGQHRKIYERIQYPNHVQERSFQYDRYGNITKLIQRWDNDIDSIYSYKATYTIDNTGNWIKRIKTSLDGKPRTEVERSITYQ